MPSTWLSNETELNIKKKLFVYLVHQQLKCFPHNFLPKRKQKNKITPYMISHSCCFMMTYKHIFFTTQLSTWYNRQDYLFLADEYSYPCAGLHRPLGLQKIEAPRTSRQLAHEGGKVASLMHWLPRSPRRYPWYSVTGWVDTMAIVWLVGLSQRKSHQPHWELNPQPSGLLHSASTNCANIYLLIPCALLH